MSNTTIIILLLVAGFAIIGLGTLLYRPRRHHHVRMEHVYRVAPQDLWAVVIPHPDRPYLLGEDQFHWDAGSATDAVISFHDKVGARFSQRADPTAMQAEQTVPAYDDQGKATERALWRIAVSPVPDGARIVIDRHFEKIGDSYPWWQTDFPETSASLRGRLSDALINSGALARYDAAHGTLPPSHRTRLWWTAFVLAMMAVCWWSSGPWPTIAVMAGLVLHEAGHVAVMRAFGDRPGAAHVVPFLGGFAIGRMQHATAWQHAVKLLGGPVAGLGSAVAAVLAGWLLDSAYLTACGYVFALLNLMNLAPIVWLDGGEFVRLALRPLLPAIAPHFSGGALLAAAFGLSLWWGYRNDLLFLLLVVWSMAGQQPPQPPHLPLSRRQGATLFVLWIGLAAMLAGMVAWLGEEGSRDHLLALKRGPFQ